MNSVKKEKHLTFPLRLVLFVGLLTAPQIRCADPPRTNACSGFLSQNVGLLTKRYVETFLELEKLYSPEMRPQILVQGSRRKKTQKMVILFSLPIVDQRAASKLDERIRPQIVEAVRRSGGYFPWVTAAVLGLDVVFYAVLYGKTGTSLLQTLTVMEFSKFTEFACPIANIADGVRWCIHRWKQKQRIGTFWRTPAVIPYVDDVPSSIANFLSGGATAIVYSTPARVEKISKILSSEYGFVPAIGIIQRILRR